MYVKHPVITSDRLPSLMNTEEVKRVYEVLGQMKWLGNESGYIPMSTRKNDSMSYIEIDARLHAAGREFDPLATKDMLLKELESIHDAAMLDPEGLESEIERELQKQEELVRKIQEATKGLNEKINGIIRSMETSHIKNQIQMMLKEAAKPKQKQAKPEEPCE